MLRHGKHKCVSRRTSGLTCHVSLHRVAAPLSKLCNSAPPSHGQLKKGQILLVLRMQSATLRCASPGTSQLPAGVMVRMERHTPGHCSSTTTGVAPLVSAAEDEVLMQAAINAHSNPGNVQMGYLLQYCMDPGHNVCRGHTRAIQGKGRSDSMLWIKRL